jgi:PIN domain nuclease of toxin-antitoxin system
LSGNLEEWVAHSTVHFHEAPLTHEIALAARELPFPHQDPADRFLAATALVLHLTLVTADARLQGLGEIATLGNR